jgi:hypothetical protein
MVQTFIYSAVMYGAEVWTRRRRSRQDVSGRRKALRSILPYPETALLTFCTGTLGYFHPVYSLMLPNCVGSTDAQNMEAGRWPKEALRFSFEGSRGVGRPKVGTDWCGNVKSITEQIQHTLNIAKVTAQAKGQPALRRVAPRRSPITRRRT